MIIRLRKSAQKELQKIFYGNPNSALKIEIFLTKLQSIPNPTTLPNAKKLQGFSNHYRWRIGDYRIIGIVENGEFKIIEIIKIAKRDDNTYK